MKLEFEITSQDTFTKHQTADSHFSADTKEMLRQGIKCAKDGSRSEARQLLFRVTEIEPENETAWMWLASISEYPEELLVFLQSVLKVNPENQRAIEWTKATKSLLAKTFVERGTHASQENRKELALQFFTQALLYDNQNEAAWLWLAANSESAEEKTAHLQQVLNINPENETALASLHSTKHEVSQSLLKRANFAAISGERETARELLAEVMQEAPELEDAWILKAYLADNSDEKIASYEKILTLNPENEAAQAGLASLKMLLQKNSEPKYSVEIIEEILESNQIDNFSAPKESNEKTAEDSSLHFVSGLTAKNDFHSASFESPTDELDADFLEGVKSQGGFADAQFADEQKSQEISAEFEDKDLVVFNETENVRADEEFQLFEATNFGQPDDADDFDETDKVFEIEVSDNENLSNIFDSAENDDELNPQEDNSGFESSNESNEMIFLSADPEAFEPLPAVEEFIQPDESFESNESLESASQEFDGEADQISKQQETQEFQDEAEPEEEFEKPADESFAGNEYSENDSFESPTPRAASASENAACPFCLTMNELQAFICNSCRTMISLSDLEMLLSHTEARADVLEMAIEDLETERSVRSLNTDELTNLGIAYLNSKNLRKGLACLQEASQLEPNNVVLSSKVNFLTIRLSEIEEQESRSDGTTLKNLTIMIVDDSPTVRKLISGKLEKCGHTVVAAADGKEALSQINEIVPDLILLDIMMPEMDGYQVCKLIRSNETTKEVPVIMISGKDGFFDKVRGRMAGTSGYITKPFGPETLMRTIETYVV